MGAAILAIPTIPANARMGHIIPGFTNNLLSLGKLWDADCTAYIDKDKLEVRDKHGNKIVQGDRKHTGARLWRVDIAPATHTPTPVDKCFTPVKKNLPVKEKTVSTHEPGEKPLQTRKKLYRCTKKRYNNLLHLHTNISWCTKNCNWGHKNKIPTMCHHTKTE